MTHAEPSIAPTSVAGSFSIRNFRFASGETLPDLRIAYMRYGELNAARDNLMLVLPGGTNTWQGVADYIGPGLAYDTDRYCVVATDAIGGGGSSQPKDGLFGAFPRYCIGDMVEAQIEMARSREGFGLGDMPVAVVAGASMGAMQALTWAIHHPDSLRAAVLMVPCARAGGVVELATDRMFELIAADPRWNDGRYREAPIDGLRMAGRQYYGWTVSDQYLETQPAATVRQEAYAAGEKMAGWDAWSVMRRYQAVRDYDAARSFDGDLARALSCVKARTLVLPGAYDRLLPVASARSIAAGVAGSRYVEVDSLRGHLAWRPVPGSPDTVFMTRQVRQFLDLS